MNAIQQKIIDLVELTYPSSPSIEVLFEDKAEVNVQLGGIQFDKIVFVDKLNKGKLKQEGNGWISTCPVSLFIGKPMSFYDKNTGTIAGKDELRADMLLFLKQMEDDTSISLVSEVEFDIFENFLDANLLAINIRFDMSLVIGIGTVGTC